MCIGNRFAMLEMRTALALMVRSYTFSLDESKPLKVLQQVVMGVDKQSGLHLVLRKR